MYCIVDSRNTKIVMIYRIQDKNEENASKLEVVNPLWFTLILSVMTTNKNQESTIYFYDLESLENVLNKSHYHQYL